MNMLRILASLCLSLVAVTSHAQSLPDITISNVIVVVSGSTGLDRDTALDMAARKAMPLALQRMDPPVTGERADTFIRSQGDLTRYVKTVKIVKEVLVPSYTLTANLTYDAQKLYANLGGRIPAAGAANTPSATTPAAPVVTDNRPLAQQTIELSTTSPTEQFKLLGILNQLPSTTAQISALSTRNAVYTLETPLSLDELEQTLAARNLSTIPGSSNGLRVSF